MTKGVPKTDIRKQMGRNRGAHDNAVTEQRPKGQGNLGVCGPFAEMALQSRPPFTEVLRARAGKCPTERFLSAFGHLPRSAPRSFFVVLFGTLAKKKNSVGHFPARAPEHSCKWWPGSRTSAAFSLSLCVLLSSVAS